MKQNFVYGQGKTADGLVWDFCGDPRETEMITHSGKTVVVEIEDFLVSLSEGPMIVNTENDTGDESNIHLMLEGKEMTFYPEEVHLIHTLNEAIRKIFESYM